jgi:hypothetical protein
MAQCLSTSNAASRGEPAVDLTRHPESNESGVAMLNAGKMWPNIYLVAGGGFWRNK